MCHRAPTKQGPKQSRRERFLPGPFWVWPHKNTAKISVFAVFFWSNSIRTYSGCFFFFFRHFFVLHVRQGSSLQQAHSTQVPCFWVYDLVFGFPSSTNWLQMKVWSKKYSKSATCPSIQHWQHLWTLKVWSFATCPAVAISTSSPSPPSFSRPFPPPITFFLDFYPRCLIGNLMRPLSKRISIHDSSNILPI